MDLSWVVGWSLIGLLSISHDLLAPLLIHIRRNLEDGSGQDLTKIQSEYWRK
ncbi:hypothetical protein [Fischerella sp. NIES-3754]|uniref:hypothetical protein n=1 Tax=Fischerella sp. NIES-3754 TaxID=1752063 RepID=UPI001E5336DB|nr:hypothetical protein [Fischerella sp. NIES-3754]